MAIFKSVCQAILPLHLVSIFACDPLRSSKARAPTKHGQIISILLIIKIGVLKTNSFRLFWVVIKGKCYIWKTEKWRGSIFTTYCNLKFYCTIFRLWLVFQPISEQTSGDCWWCVENATSLLWHLCCQSALPGDLKFAAKLKNCFKGIYRKGF